MADLKDLKEFLLSEPRGNVRVELDLKGQKIDTKLGVADTEGVEAWKSKRWG